MTLASRAVCRRRFWGGQGTLPQGTHSSQNRYKVSNVFSGSLSPKGNFDFE